MRIFKKLLQQLEDSNRRHRLLRHGDSLVVGLSGGPDSTALLYLLAKLRRKYSLRLTAAHLDHGLRKKDARRYRERAREAAERLGVPFHWKAVDVRKRSRRDGRSLEETGRLERYRFFAQVARKVRAQKIATAHTLDDQAETVLLWLFRGAGPRGLAGIPPKRRQGRLEIVRPLLAVEKKDAVALLKKAGMRYAEDPTNQDLIFTRNRIRHQVLPLLARHFNPRIKKSLAQLAEICGEIADHLEKEGGHLYRRCLETKGKGRVRLAAGRLRRAGPALGREAILCALTDLKGDLRKITHAHVLAAMETLSPGSTATRHLPGVLLERRHETLELKRIR